MKNELQKIINKCGCIDIKIIVLLFFLLVIIYSMYQKNNKENCNCN